MDLQRYREIYQETDKFIVAQTDNSGRLSNHLFFRLFIYPSAYMSPHLTVDLSIYCLILQFACNLCVHLSTYIDLSIYLWIYHLFYRSHPISMYFYLSIYQPICLSFRIYIYTYKNLSVDLPVYLTIYLSVDMPIYLSAWQFIDPLTNLYLLPLNK